MSAFEFEGHEALIAQLRAGTLEAPGHLHRRVLAGAPARRRRIAAMSARRRVLLAVPVAASLAVGVAVVQGAFFTSGPGHILKRSAAVGGAVTHGGAPNGAFGLNGPTGAAGATGAQGATGLTGVVGETGPTGPKGPTGARGPQRYAFREAAPVTPAHRAAGKARPSGPSGPSGPNGATGAIPYGTAALDSFSAAGSPPQALQALGADKGLFNSDGLTIPTGRLVHAEADLIVVVPSHDALTQATNQATQIVTGLGGYSQSVQYDASTKGYGQSFLDLRVPLGKTQAAIRALGKLGDLTQQSISTQDLTQQFTKQTNQIDQLRRAIKIYQKALQSGTLTGSQRVVVQIQLANALHELKGTVKTRSQTVKSGKTAQIRLTLRTSQHAPAGPHRTGRLGRMLHNIGTFLAIEGIVILYALIVALPIILLVALIWWLLRERRRREEELLAGSA